jgi:hypothetical protein
MAGRYGILETDIESDGYSDVQPVSQAILFSPKSIFAEQRI